MKMQFIKIIIAALLGLFVSSVFKDNPQILIFVFATLLFFIYFEISAKPEKKRYKRKSKFAKEMERFQGKIAPADNKKKLDQIFKK